MGGQFSDKSNEKFVRRPNRDIRLRTSKDGRFVMVDIIETWFFRVPYVAAVAANAGKGKSPPDGQETDGKAQDMED